MSVDPENALLAENRELKRELERARARVSALEQSRWWRLHPRFLARRVRHAQVSSMHAEGTAPRRALREDDPTTARFRETIMARGTFTEDWFTRHLHAWGPIFDLLEGRQARILEIGSYEGLSACFLLWRLEDAQLTCIDTFAGGAEHRASTRVLSTLEARFDANIALVGSSRVRKLVGDSRRQLLELAGKGARFDLIYVDGSHLALDVLIDAALAWQLLDPAGILVFDDYDWDELGTDPLLRPGPAIDAFLMLVERDAEQLFAGHQVAVRRAASRAT